MAYNVSNHTYGNISRVGSSLEEPLEDYDINYKLVGIILPIIFSVILVVGLIGNGCVISSVLRYKAMRSAPNMFILNLAVGDVLMLIIAVPIAGTLYTLQSWPFGAVMCKCSYFIKTLSFGLSIFTLTALSIDRVMVIGNTMKTLQEKATVRIIIMVATVWVAAILVAIPDAVGYHLTVEDYNGTEVVFCDPYPREWKEFNYPKIHVTAHFVIFFAVPLIIIAICYGIMARIMVKSAKCLPGESIRSSSWRMNQNYTRKRVANIVIVLVVLFAICWLPRNIFVLNGFYAKDAQMTPGLWYYRMVTYCLVFSHSCVNPIALYFLSRAFKTHYKKQLCCSRASWRTSETEIVTRQSNLQNGDCCVMTNLTNNNNTVKETTNVYDTDERSLIDDSYSTTTNTVN